MENFCVHSKNGYYNGHLIHRVIKGFMIQTGDPLGNYCYYYFSMVEIFESWMKVFNVVPEFTILVPENPLSRH